MRLVLGLFGDYAQALQAIEALQEEDYDTGSIYVLVRTTGSGQAGSRGLSRTGKTARALRQLLGRSHTRHLPEIGSVLAFNDLAVQLAETAPAEVASGGLRVALQDQGLEAHAAEAYYQGVENGMLLLFLKTEDEDALAATNLLEAHGGRSVFLFSPVLG